MTRKKWLFVLLGGFVLLLFLASGDRASAPESWIRGGHPLHDREQAPGNQRAPVSDSASARPLHPSEARLLLPTSPNPPAPRYELRADENPGSRSVSGLVRNKITSAPVSGAEVTVQPIAGGQEARLLTTNRKGEFRGELPGAARYEIRIAADGFASQKKRRVYLQKSSFLIFELTPLVRMEGRVVDFWGRGVPGARLFTSRVTHDVYARRTADRTEADPDGYFSFDSLPGEGEYSLTALHARYGAVSRTVSLPTEKSVRVRMGEPLPEIAMAVVEGQVSQPAGEPIPEATVTLFDPDNSGMLLTQTSTSLDGRFRSAPVRPGKIGVWARAEGFVTTPRNSLDLQVDEGETADVELVLAPAVPFFGKVTSRDGEPVVRATVLVGVRKSGGYAAYTDPDGTFSIRGATPGSNHLLVHHPDYLSYRGQLTLPHEGAYTIVLEQGIVLTGVARWRDGMAIRQFLLELLDADTGRLERRAQVTAQNGTFEMSGLTEARYIIRLTAEGRESAQAPLTLDRSRAVALLLDDNPASLRILDLNPG